MALGNANTTAQARGKNKAVKVKRHKEVAAASGFVQFSHGPKKPNVPASCAVSSGDMTLQGFTNNTSAGFPFLTNDYFYTKKRANPRFYVADGFYKVGPNSKGSFYTVEIVNGQVASSPRATQCP
tara:strand:+ start:621 stop:995 length:375 start_codon:yes stop_codon:yes gene_type:complete